MSKFTLTLSSAAITHIEGIMAKQAPARIFRLALKETGCTGLMYVPAVVEQAEPGDVMVDLEAPFEVAVAADSVDALNGTHIDYIEKMLGQHQLHFDNPNADSLCGCGESFNLKDKQNDG